MEDNYLNLLRNTDDIDFESLRAIINNYPWFSVPRIAWLLKHKKERPGLFPYELKKHIVYIHDRRQLFHILNTDIWQKLILDNVEDNQDKVNEPVIEDAEEYRKELLEFSYDPDQDDNVDSEQVTNSEKAISADDNEKIENEDSRSHNEFSEWIDEVEKKEKPNNLIDRFLEIDPGPIRPDKETRLRGDVSTPSVKEREGFITDTLARIYIKQGLYSKAIFAYEKLSLKYPEKSVYFASQIEEIKKLINNN